MLLERRRNCLSLYLWSRLTTSGLILQQENFRLAFPVIRITECNDRRPRKNTGQLLLEIFQEEVRQTCQV